nr:skin secretory protein xP2-like [Aegilops tauschii subsp. strangulata]
MAMTSAKDRSRGGGWVGGEKERAERPKRRPSAAVAGNPNEQSRAPRRIHIHLCSGRSTRGPGLRAGETGLGCTKLAPAAGTPPSAMGANWAARTERPASAPRPTSPTWPPAPTLGQGSGNSAATSCAPAGAAAPATGSSAGPETCRKGPPPPLPAWHAGPPDLPAAAASPPRTAAMPSPASLADGHHGHQARTPDAATL